jgi:hypothetical protein
MRIRESPANWRMFFTSNKNEAPCDRPGRR